MERPVGERLSQNETAASSGAGGEANWSGRAPKQRSPAGGHWTGRRVQLNETKDDGGNINSSSEKGQGSSRRRASEDFQRLRNSSRASQLFCPPKIEGTLHGRILLPAGWREASLWEYHDYVEGLPHDAWMLG